jgi:uncharacterized repeat protein (TIGR01451 family)
VTVTYQAAVALPLDGGTLLTNTALLSDGVGRQVEIGPATSVVSSSPDLSGSAKAVEPPVAAPGSVLTYTLALINQGTMDAPRAQLTDTLPLGVVYAANPWATSGVAGQAGGAITWTGALSVRVPVTVTYRVTVASSAKDGAWLTNTALIRDGVGGQPVAVAAVVLVRWNRLYLPCVIRTDRGRSPK